MEIIDVNTDRGQQVIAAGQELVMAAKQIGRKYRLCPWCLFHDTFMAIDRALDAGDIEHDEGETMN